VRALLGAFGLKYGYSVQTLNFKLWKIGNLHDFDINFTLKFDYGYFIIFLRHGSKILYREFQVILSKNEAVTLIFQIQNQIKIRENCRHAFILAQND